MFLDMAVTDLEHLLPALGHNMIIVKQSPKWQIFENRPVATRNRPPKLSISYMNELRSVE